MSIDHSSRRPRASRWSTYVGLAAGAGVAAIVGAGAALADSSTSPDNSFTDWLLNPQDNLPIYEAEFSKALDHAEGEFQQANTLLAQIPSAYMPETMLTDQTQLDDGAVQLLQSLDSAENVLQTQADVLIPGGGLSVAEDFTVFNQMWDGFIGLFMVDSAQQVLTAIAAGDSAQQIGTYVADIDYGDQLFLEAAVSVTNGLISLTNEIFPGQM